MKLGWGLGAGALTVWAAYLGVSHKSASTSSLPVSFFSACTPITLDGSQMYSVLKMSLAAPIHDQAPAFEAEEIAYEDANCEITVFRSNVSGTYSEENRNGVGLLTLHNSSALFTPLSSRMAESMNAQKSCGQAWIYGEAHQVLGTPCHTESEAQYIVKADDNGTDFYDCEGQSEVNDSCTRYVDLQSKKVVSSNP